MKTKTKLTFIDQNEKELTVYPFQPIEDKVKKFRREQIAKIRKDDRIYRAMARDTGNWHETRYLDTDKLAAMKDDTFSSKKIGYEYPYGSPLRNEYEYWCDEPKHIFRKADPYRSEQWKEETEDYLDGGMNKVPFRIRTNENNGKKIHNYLPLTFYVGPNMHDPRDNYGVMRGILHISDMAYLEQLLRCNKINLLATRIAEIDGSLEKLLDLFSFEEPQTINIDDVKRSEAIVEKSHKLLYGDKIFHRDVPLDPEQTEKERRPVSQDLLEQAEIDKPLIEQVKAYIKKRQV